MVEDAGVRVRRSLGTSSHPGGVGVGSPDTSTQRTLGPTNDVHTLSSWPAAAPGALFTRTLANGLG
jgi:hypothetical protein